MAYVACTGTLIAESDLVEVVNSNFDGFSKMLNRKKFPQNVRGLRTLVRELLKPVLMKV